MSAQRGYSLPTWRQISVKSSHKADWKKCCSFKFFPTRHLSPFWCDQDFFLQPTKKERHATTPHNDDDSNNTLRIVGFKTSLSLKSYHYSFCAQRDESQRKLSRRTRKFGQHASDDASTGRVVKLGGRLAVDNRRFAAFATRDVGEGKNYNDKFDGDPCRLCIFMQP